MCYGMRKTMSSYRNRDSYSWHFHAWILFSKSKKSTPLLLASITSERWSRGVHMRSRSYVKTPRFQGLYASKQLQKNRITSYKFETNNRRSGPKGRGFESRHFDTMNSLAITLWLRAFFFFGAGGMDIPLLCPVDRNLHLVV